MTSAKTPRQFYALIALSLIGIGLSIYLSQHFYQVHNGAAGFKSFCNLGGSMNCDAVAASTYAELFAGIPLSALASGWFLGIAAVALLGMGADWRRVAVRVLIGMSAISVAATVFYLSVMIGILHTYCLFCLLLDAVNIAIFGVALSLKSRLGEPAPSASEEGTAMKTMLGTVAGCVFVAIVATKGMDTSDLKREDIDLFAQGVLTSAPLPVGTDSRFPSLGPANAPITVVEFSDFQCPFCRMAALQLNTVLNRYPGKIRVVFRNFPLDQSCNSAMQHPGHPVACEAARVAYCAHSQGKFKEAYEEIYENQSSLAPGKPAEFAQNAGVDPARLQQCLKDPATSAAIIADIEEGKRLQVQSTPTLFVNGHKIESGMPPLPVWDKIVSALAK